MYSETFGRVAAGVLFGQSRVYRLQLSGSPLSRNSRLQPSVNDDRSLVKGIEGQRVTRSRFDSGTCKG